MGDSVIYQSSTLSKRKIFPGVIILHTPNGRSVDFETPIIVKPFTILNEELKELEGGSYDVSKMVFTYKFPTKSTKKLVVNDEKMLYNKFIDGVTRNEVGEEYKTFVVIQPSEMKGTDLSMVQAVELTFTMNDKSTVTTDKIFFVQGKVTKKKESTVTIDEHFTHVIDTMYNTLSSGDPVDFPELIEQLPTFDNSKSFNHKMRSVNEKFREKNNKTKHQPIEMVSPHYLTVQQNSLFFVLLKKQENRPQSDYTVEQFYIEPYDCGFNINMVSDVDVDSLYQAQEMMYKGQSFADYYKNALFSYVDYYVVLFTISDIQDDNTIASNLSLTLQLPFNTMLNTYLVITKDARHGIIDLDMLRTDVDAIGMMVQYDPNDFAGWINPNEQMSVDDGMAMFEGKQDDDDDTGKGKSLLNIDEYIPGFADDDIVEDELFDIDNDSVDFDMSVIDDQSMELPAPAPDNESHDMYDFENPQAILQGLNNDQQGVEDDLLSLSDIDTDQQQQQGQILEDDLLSLSDIDTDQQQQQGGVDGDNLSLPSFDMSITDNVDYQQESFNDHSEQQQEQEQYNDPMYDAFGNMVDRIGNVIESDDDDL
jgi:hypothetical protein